MKNQTLSVLSIVLISMLFAACTPRPQTTNMAATPVAIVQGDPTEGQASLMINLQNAGAQVELGDPVVQPFFTMQG